MLFPSFAFAWFSRNSRTVGRHHSPPTHAHKDYIRMSHRPTYQRHRVNYNPSSFLGREHDEPDGRPVVRAPAVEPVVRRRQGAYTVFTCIRLS
jgi:hypothetical protein